MHFELLSPSEQVANHLRAEILKGRWRMEFPGTPVLSKELGIDRKTVIAAIRQLESEGRLASQGPGKPRLVVDLSQQDKRVLNIRLLPYEAEDRQRPHALELIPRIQELGHHIEIDRKSLTDLKMDIQRIRQHMEDRPADAWIPVAASREVLEWMAGLQTPVMAMFGRRRSVPVASVGPDKASAMRACVRRLVELGHRRIVLMAREERRHPTPGYLEQQFLNELQSHGITPGAFHLPEWKNNNRSFHECLERLFEHTPPTALIVDEAQFFVAAMQHLARRRLSVPEDVSLVSSEYQPTLEWCQPAASHIHWDFKPVVDHIVHWVAALAQGRSERMTADTPATFVEGGTIGPAPGQS